MPKLTITCGVSASGKSTWARENQDSNTFIIERDEVRFDLFTNGVADWRLYKHTKEKEKRVTELCLEVWNSLVLMNYNVIVSDTNLKQSAHNYWKDLADKAGYDFEIKYLSIDLDEAIKRDSKRGLLSVGRNVILQQWQNWLKIYPGHKFYVPNENLLPAIICDLDGTLADMAGLRGPFDWEKVGLDKCRVWVKEILYSYLDKYPNVQLIICSGRDGVCEPETRKWLLDNDIWQDALFMRRQGDLRKDSIIKEEIFWESIAPNYNVLFCIDDRPQIVRTWKDLGLNVLDVSKSYLEF